MIQLKGVKKSFGGEELLKDITFSVEPGERISLLGPGGCGKTTILKIILGLLTPPVGLILNVVAVIGRTDVSSVFRESIPYLAVLTVVLMIVTYVPAVSLWLPRLLMPT